ncbi:hypothetical protein TGRH88_008080 [Toxoplasma gondii]|uniref:LisH domain-containing protein n=1 Tax=Toxoplasma gondii TaxID=5811 RepID=A0A7J6KDY8_TOXGO|nr:hypothetical protein TGRH88_008080 [Toxoplasma gondii]
MIREYLLFNRYHNTLSVFLSETGLDDAEPLAKDILEEAVNIIREPRDCLPLLYRFASSNRRDIEEALNTRRVHSSEETHAGTDAQSQYAASRPAF